MLKKVLAAIFFSVAVILPGLCWADFNDENILIKFKNSKSIEDVSERYAVDKTKIEKISEFDVYKIENKNWKTKLILGIDKIFSRDIEYIESDSEFKGLIAPNDTYYSDQWALPKISADRAWD